MRNNQKKKSLNREKQKTYQDVQWVSIYSKVYKMTVDFTPSSYVSKYTSK